MALVATLAGCIVDDGTGDVGDSSGAASTSGAMPSSESAAPSTGTADDGDDGDDGGPSTSASASGTEDSGSADDTAGSDGPACDPFPVSEVDGCAATVGEGFCSEGAAHVRDGTEIPWMSDPPHSGPHYPMWASWGEHESTVPRGNWVHNLEHGGIVLSYLCPGGCDAELDVLRGVIEARPDVRILMTPDPLLPGPRFAAISWTWVLRTDAPDLETLLCFVDQHENHAPEDVP